MPNHGRVEENHVNAVVKVLVKCRKLLPVRQGGATSLFTSSHIVLGQNNDYVGKRIAIRSPAENGNRTKVRKAIENITTERSVGSFSSLGET